MALTLPGRRAAVAALALAAALPVLVPPGGTAMFELVLAAAYVLMALGLNVIVGFAGLLDLGYVAFFALGAYVMAYFGSTYWEGAGGGAGIHVLAGEAAAELPGIHLNFLLVLVLAVGATTAAGMLIGVPTLRLRGDYIAVVTLAFGEIIGRIAANGREIALFGGTLTAGPKAITPIDRIDLPLIGRFGALDLRPWYWAALALVALALLVNVRLRDSRIGRAWLAVREDEVAAATAGISPARLRLLAYGVGAAFGGVAGAFLASFLSTVDAGQFEFSFSVFVFAMVVVGGVGSVRGSVLVAVALTVFNSYLLPDVLAGLPGRLGLDLDVAAISYGIYGLLLVLVVLLRPQGLWPDRRRVAVLERTGRA